MVSIIIPVFNTGAFLPETLASVERQTISEWEVVLVDNGSTDTKTLELLNLIKEKYKVIRTDSVTVSEARNLGIEASTGEFILPLDSDDLIEPTFLEKCLQVFQQKPETTVVRTLVRLFGKKSGVLTLPTYNFSLLLARNLMVVSSMFRKADCIAVGGFDSRFVNGFEDWEFWINLLKEGGAVETVNEPLFSYRIRKGSRNHSLKFEHFKEARRLVWEKHRALFSVYFLDPTACFEYQFVTDSKAYKIGSLVTKPFNFLKVMR
ncbi:MAG: glycosyltransferase family 2 protein [Luteibaculaceae bacterium]